MTKTGTTQRNRRGVTQRNDVHSGLDQSTVDGDCINSESSIQSLTGVVGSGDRPASLRVIRDKLAVELAAASGKDCAPLALRLQAVMAELDSLTTKTEESCVDKLRDELAAKRADRERNASAG